MVGTRSSARQRGDGRCSAETARGPVLVVSSGSGRTRGMRRLSSGTGRGQTGQDGMSSLHLASFLQLPVRVWREIPAQRRAHGRPCSPRGRDFMSPRCHRLVSRRSASGVQPCLLPSSTRVPGEDTPAGANLLPADDVDGVLGLHGSRQRWTCLLTPARGGTI